MPKGTPSPALQTVLPPVSSSNPPSDESDDDEGFRIEHGRVRGHFPKFLPPGLSRSPDRMGIMQPHPVTLAKRQQLEARAGKASKTLVLKAHSFEEVMEAYFEPLVSLQSKYFEADLNDIREKSMAQQPEFTAHFDSRNSQQQQQKPPRRSVSRRHLSMAGLDDADLEDSYLPGLQSLSGTFADNEPLELSPIASPNGVKLPPISEAATKDTFVPLNDDMMNFFELDSHGYKMRRAPDSKPQLELPGDARGNMGKFFKERRLSEQRGRLMKLTNLLPPRYRPAALSVQDPKKLPKWSEVRRARSSMQ